ncbi:DNA-directed RNA polymerase III subunit RPC3-like isoform X2 [Dysidea avara]|uniref:DNA-directed RNA polymerase III subunit RPC3-like isoform X2 n=1 Tax=Dysidea avara TaxID=196820 RepID=UPI003317B4B0
MERTRLCGLILREHFGDAVEQVGIYLMKNGARPLHSIIRDCKYDRATVQKCLCSLLQHQLIWAAPNKMANVSLYDVDMNRILWFTRYAKFIHKAKVTFGDVGELIVENLLLQGQNLMSGCVQIVSEKLDTGPGDGTEIGEAVKQKFIDLIDAKVLHRVSCPSSSESDAITVSHHQLPPTEGIQYKRKRSTDGLEVDGPSRKKSKREDGAESLQPPDAGIFWCINFSWFHHYLRVEAIVKVVATKIDTSAGHVMRAVLTAATVVTDDGVHYNTKDVSNMDISRTLSSEINLSAEVLDQYLSLLTDHKINVLGKCGDSGGGTYSINYKHLDTMLCQSTIESIVREKFGSKSYRIFRLLLMKKSLEQKQVAEMAMIPTKEVKAILYSLVAEKYLTLQEIPRSGETSKTVYLFSVNLQRLARSLLDQCYKALGNMMTRRIQHNEENKKLLEKYSDYETKRTQLLHNDHPPSQEELDEIEDTITALEKAEAEKCRDVIAKLEYAELQLDETIMFISNYIISLFS